MRVVDDLACITIDIARKPNVQGKVTYLDEWLDLAPALQLLSTHASRYFPWVAFDPGDNGMWVWSLFGALIQLLNYDDLFAGMAALQGDCDLDKIRDQRLA